MHLKTPEIGLLRELSPEVPPDVQARLILGEPPVALRPFSHPVATLFRDRWEKRGCVRIDVAKQLSDSSKTKKTLRRIDQILNGERLQPEWLKRLRRPPRNLRSRPGRRLDRERGMGKKNRHLLSTQRSPSHIRPLRPLPPSAPSQAPPPPDTRVSYDQRIEPLFEVHGDPDPTELTSWLQSHADRFIEGKSPIAGWLYLRAPEELHFFSTDGTLLLTGHADLPTPPNLETPYVPLWRNRL